MQRKRINDLTDNEKIKKLRDHADNIGQQCIGPFTQLMNGSGNDTRNSLQLFGSLSSCASKFRKASKIIVALNTDDEEVNDELRKLTMLAAAGGTCRFWKNDDNSTSLNNECKKINEAVEKTAVSYRINRAWHGTK